MIISTLQETLMDGVPYTPSPIPAVNKAIELIEALPKGIYCIHVKPTDVGVFALVLRYVDGKGYIELFTVGEKDGDFDHLFYSLSIVPEPEEEPVGLIQHHIKDTIIDEVQGKFGTTWISLGKLGNATPEDVHNYTINKFLPENFERDTCIVLGFRWDER